MVEKCWVERWTSHSTIFYPTSFYLSSTWIALHSLSTGNVQRTLGAMPTRLNEICPRPNHPLPGRTTGPSMASQLYVATQTAPFRMSQQYTCTPILPIVEGISMVEKWWVKDGARIPPIFYPTSFYLSSTWIALHSLSTGCVQRALGAMPTRLNEIFPQS